MTTLDADIVAQYQALLPQGARDLIAVVGIPAALRLFEVAGGRVIDMAKGKRLRGKAQIQALGEIVGAVAAGKLSKHYGGAPLRVPRCVRVVRRMRDASIQQRFDALDRAGYSARKAVSMIVGEFGIDDRTVWRVLKRDVEVVASGAAPRSGETNQMALALS